MTKHEIIYYEANKKGYVNESEMRIGQIDYLKSLGYLHRKKIDVLGDTQWKPTLTDKGKRYVRVVNALGSESLRRLSKKEWDYLEKNTMLRRDFLTSSTPT